MKPAPTLRELREELLYWQTGLGLKNWKIRLSWGKPAIDPCYSKGEMMHDAYGNCCWSTKKKQAWIYLNKESTNLVGTLIHEMLHLCLEGHRADPDGNRDRV